MITQKSLEELLALTKCKKVYTAGLGHAVEELAINCTIPVYTQIGSEEEVVTKLWREHYLSNSRSRVKSEIDFWETESEAISHAKDKLSRISLQHHGKLGSIGRVTEHWFHKLIMFFYRNEKKEFDNQIQILREAFELIDNIPKSNLPTIFLPDIVSCADIILDQELFIIDESAIVKGENSMKVGVVSRVELASELTAYSEGVDLDITLLVDNKNEEYRLSYKDNEKVVHYEYHIKSSRKHRLFYSLEAANKALDEITNKIVLSKRAVLQS